MKRFTWIALLFCVMFMTGCKGNPVSRVSATSYFQNGCESYQKKEYADAIDAFKETIRNDENDDLLVYTYSYLGHCMMEQGDRETAGKYYEMALATGEEPAMCYTNLGLFYRKNKEYEQAEQYYRKALEADPECAESLTSLGMLYVILDRVEEGVPLLSEAIKKSEDAPAFYYANLAYGYAATGEFQDGKDMLLVAKAKGYPEEEYQLVLSYMESLGMQSEEREGVTEPGKEGNPAPSPTVIPTLSPTPSPSPTPTATATPTPTATATPSPTATATPSPTPSPTATPTPTVTPTPTATPSPTPSPTATPTPSPTPTVTPTPTPSPTPSPTPHPTATPTPTSTVAPKPGPGEEPKPTKEAPKPPKEQETEKVKKIVIDPGHQLKGDYDTEPVGPGATEMKTKVSTGTQGITTKIPEHQFNLELSLLLKDALEAEGYEVILTRETADVNISNAERAELANEVGADIFIRIHADGAENTEANGISVLYPSQNNPYVGDLSAESKRLADHVLKKLCERTGAKKRGIIERDDLTGINWAQMPVIVVEAGFMTNEVEELKLVSRAYQTLLAKGIVEGVKEYSKK